MTAAGLELGYDSPLACNSLSWTMNPGSGLPQRHARRHSYIPTTLSTPAEPSSSAQSPPAYQSTSRRHGSRSSRRHSQQALPGYAQAVALELQRPGDDNSHGSIGRQQHEFYMLSGSRNDTRVWATLKVTSRATTSNSSSTQKVPKFFGGDQITGCVQLDLNRPQTINSITVSVSDLVPLVRICFAYRFETISCEVTLSPASLKRERIPSSIKW